eukprot:6119651-Alexandrium_andersonii.AAC.1
MTSASSRWPWTSDCGEPSRMTRAASHVCPASGEQSSQRNAGPRGWPCGAGGSSTPRTQRASVQSRDQRARHTL